MTGISARISWSRIEPIITNGDLIGGIIVISDTSFNKDEIALVDYTVKILNNYIEQ